MEEFTKICAANSISFAENKKWVVMMKNDEFKMKILDVIKDQTVIGDPLDPKTTLGPLALRR